MEVADSLTHIQQRVAEGQLSCRALVEGFLQRIEARPELNAFLEVYAEEALARATEIDAKVRAGTAGSLHGLVIGVKDNIVQEGHLAQAGSQLLDGFTSPYSATALRRLLDADAIVIGRMNCDEFAMGSSNENSSFGPVQHPDDAALVPGGSSGGSAAAVRAGLCHAALGSDTGGSIRQPAAFCGSVGLKTTYGRISRYGLIAYASSFDQIGPITPSIELSARMLEVMAGQDPLDTTTATAPVPSYWAEAQQTGGPYRIGVIRETLTSYGLSPAVKTSVEAQLDALRAAGHTVEMVDFPLLEYLVPTYYILTTAEAASNLARFDGIRYGHRAEAAESVDDIYTDSRSEGFGPEVQRRILLGNFVLSAGYQDAFYAKAQRVRRLIREATRSLLTQYDLLLSPTTPTPPFERDAKTDDPVAMYLSDVFTVQANLAGVPAISLPIDNLSTDSPIGLQVIGDEFTESKLFNFSYQLLKR